MNKLWILPALALSVAPAAFGQTAKTDPKQPDPNVVTITQKDPLGPDQLRTPLALSEDQFKEIAKFYEAKRSRDKGIDADNSLSPQDKKLKKDQSRTTYVSDSKRILTEDQKKKLDDIVRGGKGETPKGDLKLSPEQREKLNKIREKYSKMIKDLQSDKTLDPQTKRERMHDLQKQMITEFRGMLDPNTQGDAIRGVDAIQAKTDKNFDKKYNKEDGGTTPPKEGDKKAADPPKSGDKKGTDGK